MAWKIDVPLEAMVQLLDMGCSTAKGASHEEFREALFPDEDTPVVALDMESSRVLREWRKMQDDFAGWFRGLDIAYKLAFTRWAFTRCAKHVPDCLVTLMDPEVYKALELLAGKKLPALRDAAYDIRPEPLSDLMEWNRGDLVALLFDNYLRKNGLCVRRIDHEERVCGPSGAGGR